LQIIVIVTFKVIIKSEQNLPYTIIFLLDDNKVMFMLLVHHLFFLKSSLLFLFIAYLVVLKVNKSNRGAHEIQIIAIFRQKNIFISLLLTNYYYNNYKNKDTSEKNN